MRSLLPTVRRFSSMGSATLLVPVLLAGPTSAADEPEPSAASDTEAAPAAEVQGLGGAWRRMAAAPFGAVDVAGGWTGTELVVVDPEQKRRAAAYYPALDRWRAIARPPWRVDAGSPAHWTGTELVFVEERGSAKRGLAAYDPVADTWRTTAPSPMNDIAASVWAEGVIVAISGSTLAPASYDPAADAWTELPPMPLPEGSTDAPAAEPLSLHWTGEQVLALTSAPEDADASFDGAEPTLAFVPLDLAEATWGAPSTGPLSASASPPLWTGESFAFLTEPDDAEEGPRSGSYDPAADTWTLTENRCGVDTAEAVWTDSLVIGLPQRRAFDPTSGQCYMVPIPPWAERSRPLRVWTGTEVLEFSGVTKGGSSARRDGLAYDPFPKKGSLGVAVDKASRPARVRVPSLGIDLAVISDEKRVKGSSPGYPACDVALYWSYFDLPGEPGTTWLLAHAQAGMFLPLLEQMRSSGAKSLLGRRVELQLRDGRLLTYRTNLVKPRSNSSDLRIATKDRSEGEHRLVLQTSTGTGSAPKLEVAASLVDVATTDEPRPKARPRACG